MMGKRSSARSDRASRPRPETSTRSSNGSKHKPKGYGSQKKKRASTATAAVRDTPAEIRLNRFLAEAGIASRRKADEMIQAGEVQVNGRTVTEMGIRVRPQRDVVSVKGRQVSIDAQLVYILLNKPKDCITTTDDERGRRTVLELIPLQHRIFPVGRLDRNTTGTLLLTNDGDLAYKLTHPRFGFEKVYRVHVDKKVTPGTLRSLRTGVRLDDGPTAPCRAELLDPPLNLHVGLILTEGRNRQVRRMFEALGYKVKKLERVAYAGLNVDDLKRGEWRYLDETEVTRLKKLASKMKGSAHAEAD